MGTQGTEAPHLRNSLQALQLVVLSNVYIWKLWWLALALSGLMLDLVGGREAPRSLSSTETGSAQGPARLRSGPGGGAGGQDLPQHPGTLSAWPPGGARVSVKAFTDSASA